MGHLERKLISLVMIVKDEETVLKETIELVKEIVDEFVICDTGSTDNTIKIIEEYAPAISIPFTNYVDTKNEALKKASGEYIIMLDADERITGGLDRLKRYAEEGKIDAVSGQIQEKAGDEITNSYNRVRMWRNDGNWEFKGPGVHEYIECSKSQKNVEVDKEIIVHHDHSHRTKEDKIKIRARFEKYVEILKDAIIKNQNDHRAWFYLARTYKDLNKPLLAVESYDTYLSIPGNEFRDEIWQANFDIAHIYKGQGEYAKAIEACESAIKVDDRRAEAYNLYGNIFYALNKWEQASVLYKKALQCEIPEDVVLFVNNQDYYQKPADNLAYCYYQRNEFRKAERLTMEILEKTGIDNSRLHRNLSIYRKQTQATIFLTLGETPEPVYGGILEQQGVHGVETTYIELADELNKLGHTVFLFCNCKHEHVYNGVYYIPSAKLKNNMNLKPDYIITSRWFDSLYFDDSSKKIVWLQDAYFAEPTMRDLFSHADAIVCSSKWHRSYTAERYIERIDVDKIKIIPLGIRKELFLGNISKDPNKMIYSSNPDRGLYILLDMWGEINKVFPKTYLDVYYGWEGLKTWKTTPEWESNIALQQKTVMEKIGQLKNVTLKGRLTKRDLANEMMAATLCLYPNNFYETFCLTALETQAAGVPMVTTDMGALTTTLNRDSNILISGDPYSPAYKQKFVGQTLALLENTAMLRDYANGCREFIRENDCTWDHIALKWQKLMWSIK